MIRQSWRTSILLGVLLNTACAVTIARKVDTPASSPQSVAAPAAPMMGGRQAARPLGFANTDQLFAEWEQPESATQPVDRFEIQIDTLTRTNLGKPQPTVVGPPATYKVSIGTFAVGPHTATLYACNVSGCTASLPTVFSVEVPITAPSAPSNLRITNVSSNTVALMWDDTSVNEDGFKLEQDGAEIATFGPNATAGTAFGLMPATSYSFRTRAFNAVGYSPYSSPTIGTTLPPPPPEDTSAPSAAITFFRRNGNSRNYSATVQGTDVVGIVKAIFLVDNRIIAILTTPSSGSPQNGTYSISFSEGGSGSHLFTVQLFDAQGNTGTASRTFVR